MLAVLRRGVHTHMPGLIVRYQSQLDDIDCTAGAMYCNDQMTRR